MQDLQGSSRFDRRAVKVDEAARLVLEAVRTGGHEIVPLKRAAGRRLSEQMRASCDWPPFARSGLDGYAVRSADTAQASPQAPAALRVVYAVAAGELAPVAVEQGTAVRIMTGGAVPEGADAVVMLEQTEDAWEGGQPVVRVKRAAAPGQNIAPPGEEFRRGSLLAEAGALLRPGHLALLGTFGYANVPVFARPRVAVLATGAELLPVAAPLAPGSIRDSNSAMVAAMAEQSGAVALPLGRLADDRTTVVQALASALAQADIVVTTGGVSVGDYDIMAAVMHGLRSGEPDKDPSNEGSGQAGDRLLFNKVAMRPGSPTSAAIVQGKLLLALSGNPGACFVGFELFVRPAILHMQGASREAALPKVMTARLAASYEKGSPHERFVRTRLYVDQGMLHADPLAFGKSSMMASIPDAEGLIRIPAGPSGPRAGTLVDVLLL
ncbi:molybdopterin molybdotransferase MoeA [Paenibacillus sepulcri]|uniref:molybdopterin molybdotransferase MoeA n=1 Tax=Paenibacillus sepulcri TaxID=359917 RepID=UPI0035EE47D9